MIKETEENTWKDSSCSWTGRITIIKMSILLKTIYRFNVTPINYNNIVHRHIKSPKIHIKSCSQSDIEKKSTVDFKLYYIAVLTKIVMKTEWYS